MLVLLLGHARCAIAAGPLALAKNCRRTIDADQDDLTIVASYIDRDRRALQMRQDGGFILRAVIMSIRRFQSGNITGRAARRLNDISISKVNSIRMQRVTGAVGRSTLAGFVLMTVSVLDHNP